MQLGSPMPKKSIYMYIPKARTKSVDNYMYSITKSEVVVGKSQTEALPY